MARTLRVIAPVDGTFIALQGDFFPDAAKLGLLTTSELMIGYIIKNDKSDPSDICGRVKGKISKVFVKHRQKVKRGQVLFTVQSFSKKQKPPS